MRHAMDCLDAPLFFAARTKSSAHPMRRPGQTRFPCRSWISIWMKRLTASIAFKMHNLRHCCGRCTKAAGNRAAHPMHLFGGHDQEKTTPLGGMLGRRFLLQPPSRLLRYHDKRRFVHILRKLLQRSLHDGAGRMRRSDGRTTVGVSARVSARDQQRAREL